MKKGFGVFVLVFISTILAYAPFSSAACPGTPGPGDTLVCGHCPDSNLGYGQVLLGNITLSCDNTPDGICPEDYQDIYGRNASCSSCIDPDCTGTISGTVVDNLGVLLIGSTVKANPIKWNASAPSLERSAPTTAPSGFNFLVPTGTYYFSASQDGYDTQLLETTVDRNKVSTLNFQLQDGTCHDDCTNSYNRCNAACNGVNVSSGDECAFYDVAAASICDNRVKGTELYYDDYVMPDGSTNATHAYFVNCCEGTPYLKYYTIAEVDTTTINDLVKVEKVAKYNDRPVRVVIAYWTQ